ncbi:MAG: metal ABC transporter ATP-binding protein [Desulfohalobiaceae bacterium]
MDMKPAKSASTGQHQMEQPALQIQGLSFAYSSHLVLEDVHLTLQQGDFMFMLGPNGGGKTTLIKILLGILPYSKGIVRVLGHAPGQAPHLAGYVPQHASGAEQFPINVLEVVLMGRLGRLGRIQGYRQEDRDLALQALEQVEMSDYRDTLISNLSGGQKQRVLIARALTCQPRIIFLDEPTASVDYAFQSRLYEILNDLNSSGITVVVISHDLSVLSSHAKSVACVNRQLYHHSPGEIDQQVLEKIYGCPVDLVTHGSVPHRVLKRHS